MKSTVWILLPGHQRLSPEDGDQKGLVTAWRSQKGRCGDEERGLQTVHESSICREHANCNANPVEWSFASGLGQQLLKRFRGLRCRVEWYAGHELCMLDSCHTTKLHDYMNHGIYLTLIPDLSMGLKLGTLIASLSTHANNNIKL